MEPGVQGDFQRPERRLHHYQFPAGPELYAPSELGTISGGKLTLRIERQGKLKRQVIKGTDKETLHAFVQDSATENATIYTDDLKSYGGLPFTHGVVKHSVSEYVNGQTHTNGIESFRALLKRGYHGIYHHMNPRHLQRYINEFAGRADVREKDTIAQMTALVAGSVGKRLMYIALIKN